MGPVTYGLARVAVIMLEVTLLRLCSQSSVCGPTGKFAAGPHRQEQLLLPVLCCLPGVGELSLGWVTSHFSCQFCAGPSQREAGAPFLSC